MIKLYLVCAFCFLICFSRFNAAAGLIISEFMAANSGGIQDEDGDSSDWIEIHNDSAMHIDLAGWHLTGSAADLTKWTFPATNLPSNGYLIVFASGKNRANAGGELHTNFQLDKDGDYLALVQPDGVTVAQEFSIYPPQRENISYGLELQTTVTQLISTGALARVLVPSNGTLGLTWTARNFSDAAWLATNTPIGFSAGLSTNSVLAIDVNERGVDPAGNTQSGFASFVINSNVSSATIQTQATTRAYGSISVTVSNTAPLGYDDRLRGTPVDSGAFSDSLLLRDVIFSREDTGTGGLDVTISGLTLNQPYTVTVWSFDSGSAGARVSDWSANGVTVTNGYTFNGSVLPTSNEQYRFTFPATATAAGKIVLSGRRNPASTTFGVFLNALKVDSLSSAPATNGLSALMLSNNATAYIRIPFTVSNPNTFQMLKLRMKYDDGFVAYINGELVASRNAPASPSWNSAASAVRPDADTQIYEDILIANTPGLLVNGANVLAIQGLNATAADPDFLVLPELQGVVSNAYAARYFSPATPGADNGAGYLGLVDEPGVSVPRGFYDAPFTVALTNVTAGATIYCTIDGSIPSPSNGILYTNPVAINGTTLLRAAAFLPGYLPSVPITHTYIFLSQVLQQPANPPGYPMTWQGGYPADYGMDPGITFDANYGVTITNDLRAIPTISLVADFNSLWNSSTGICVDATQSGDFWQRPASIEMFEGNNATDFQINCGVQMQGNAGRDNARTPKHSFRFVFSSAYGPGKLNFNLFPGSEVDSFDTFILRGAWTDNWATRYSDSIVIPGTTNIGTRYRPEEALNLRDVWVKDSQRAMGNWLVARSDFIHLYVNGLYWGLYNDSEHMDADFVSSHIGGRKGDWDLLVGSDTTSLAEVVAGSLTDWQSMMALVNAGITNETAYQAVGQLVDIDNLIDYMLIHLFAEVEDWPHHNWYAAHRHAANGLPATKWIFLTWDQDIALDQLVRRNRIDVNNNDTPARIYSQLRAWPEFRREFGDRIQKHFFNGGALTPSNNIVRMMARAARIDRAIVGDSARWGDARKFPIGANPGTGVTFTRDEWWLPELQKLYTNFFVTLTETNVARFRAGNLYPTLGAPDFNQFGGNIPAGFSLVMTHTNASGTIYFTRDGSDPRLYGSGAIAPSAEAYASPVQMNQPTILRARVRDAANNWSALVEAIFTTPADFSKLAVTEIMYNPPALGTIPGNSLEFLELKNVGTNTLNLGGLTFTAGINFAFTNGTFLGSGQFFVLARDAAAFAAKYPGVTVNGVYGGQLDNSGETVTLSFPGGGNVFSVSYGDKAPWPVTPNGQGFSLVPEQPGVFQAPDDGAKWRASAFAGGSPGADDPNPYIAPIVVNEILTHTDPPEKDTIELFNPCGTNVNLGGWFLSDDSNTPRKYRIPDGITIGAGNYIFFDESQFNTGIGGNIPFAFSSTGEAVYVFSALPDSQLTGYSHGFEFGPIFNGVAFERYVNSVGEELLPMETSLTFGVTNSSPRIGPIIINEIHYHPAPDGDEFVEIMNTSGSAVPLFDPINPTNTWKVGGLGYTFPTNVTLGPAQLLLLVATNPASFRTKYNVPATVQILPISGTLDNNGERLTLQAPDSPNVASVPYVVVEEVRYDRKAPWPADADGGGASLQRLSALAFGNDPTNWAAATPTPGCSGDAEDSDGDGLPDWWEITHGTNWKVPDANADPDQDGMSNLQEFLAGTDPQNPQSWLKLDARITSAALVNLQFMASSNRTYSILYKNSLAGPSWSRLVDVTARDTNWINTVQDAINGTNRFYRLVTPMLP